MMRDIFGRETYARIYRSALDVLYDNSASFTGSHRDGLTLTVDGLSF
jgi:hypothetical protein